MKRDMGELLDHVPVLVKAYGRWPSFAYLVWATTLKGGLVAGIALLVTRLWH